MNRNQDDYQLLKKLHLSKYSDHFEAVDLKTGKKCLIKVLKPAKKTKIDREIRILEVLRGGPNIPVLCGVLGHSQTGYNMLVFENYEIMGSMHYKELFQSFTGPDIRHYIRALVTTLDYCHSMGVMHRDVKPHNIMYSLETKQLTLTGWSTAEFYHPGGELSTRPRARKAPELLLDFTRYTPAVDMWGVGCVLLGILAGRDPVFCGHDNFDMLVKMAKILGAADLFSFRDKYNIKIHSDLEKILDQYRDSHREPERLIPEDRKHLVGLHTMAFIDKLLVFDHEERLSAHQALSHPYLGMSSTEPVMKKAKLDDKL